MVADPNQLLQTNLLLNQASSQIAKGPAVTGALTLGTEFTSALQFLSMEKDVLNIMIEGWNDLRGPISAMPGVKPFITVPRALDNIQNPESVSPIKQVEPKTPPLTPGMNEMLTQSLKSPAR
ncbi:MAG: hypothetical protein J0H68_03255 [Sphingobacteriia bacterium]|nr:hypothetical protein [Sphingobacteriia bacterium]